MRTFEVIQQLFIADYQTFVIGLYGEFLYHDPNPQELEFFIECLRSGKSSKEDIFRSVITSIELGQLFTQLPQLIKVLQEIMRKEDNEFITKVYADILGELPTLIQIHDEVELLRTGESKLKILQNQLRNNNLIKSHSIVGNILQGIFNQDNNTFITNLYRELLNRNPDNKEIDASLLALGSGISKAAIFKSIIQGTEFIELIQKSMYQSCVYVFQRLLSMEKETFVSEVFNECYGRNPRMDEFNLHVDLVRNGARKMDILTCLLLSDEAISKFHEMNNVKSSELWPHLSIDSDLREKFEKILREHNFYYETNILVKTGGLGDFVQMTPVAKALKIKEPLSPIVAVIDHAASLFDEHPYIDLTIECGPVDHRQVVKSLVGLVENVFDLNYVSRAYGTWQNTDYYHEKIWYYDSFPQSGSRIDDLNMHVSDIMLYSLGLNQYADCNDVFIQPDMAIEIISGDYVVVSDSPGSVAGELKRWSSEGWDSLIKWLHLQGIIPVQLGLSQDRLIHPGVMDMRGKATPRQIAGYLAQSRGYVGIEGGLYNLAKAVGTPAVVIFAATSDTSFAYPDTRVVTKRLCRPCMWCELWGKAKCLQGCKMCLNLPEWKDVAIEVAEMLNIGGE